MIPCPDCSDGRAEQPLPKECTRCRGLTYVEGECPDCGTVVLEVSSVRHGHVLAEPARDGTWIPQRPFHNEPLPWVLNAEKHSAVEGKRYRFHRCSRAARVKDDLATLAAAYAGRKTGPRVSVPLTALDAPNVQELELNRGDALTLYDSHGNQCRAVVDHVEFVAVVKLETVHNPKADAKAVRDALVVKP